MNQKLAVKMVAAMNDIEAVTKSGKNEKQGYKYVKAADVANEVRKVLVKHGIAFFYSIDGEDRWEKATNSGGSMFFCRLFVTVTFVDSESGESFEVKGIGWGADSLDKAPYKAMTGALKYVLRMAFIIPDEADDPENDSNGSNGHQETQRAAKTPSSPEDGDPGPNYDNDYDAHMQTPKPPVPQVRKQGPVISEAQAKRFFGIAMGSGKSKEQINNYVATKGYNHSSEFLKSEYEAHCEWAAK